MDAQNDVGILDLHTCLRNQPAVDAAQGNWGAYGVRKRGTHGGFAIVFHDIAQQSDTVCDHEPLAFLRALLAVQRVFDCSCEADQKRSSSSPFIVSITFFVSVRDIVLPVWRCYGIDE